MIGIYKITSPSKKIYIGQSIDIKKRWQYYYKLNCKAQQKLYYSLQKYGVNNHKFEIIALCLKEDLNELEIYYSALFNSTNQRNGLNIKECGKNGTASIETRQKMSKSAKGRKLSNETKNKIGKANIGRNIGKICSKETRNKLSDFNLGKKLSKETRKKMSISCKYNGAKKVINIETGDIYNSIKEVSLILNIKFTTLVAKLSGQNKNNTKYKLITKNN
jgi:group I intron endonuclease